MFINLPTTKKHYAINLDKVLFFYPYKDNVTRFELEDGTLLDAQVNYEVIYNVLQGSCVSIPYVFST